MPSQSPIHFTTEYHRGFNRRERRQRSSGFATRLRSSPSGSPIESPPEIAKTAKPSFAVIRCHSGSHSRGKPSPIRPPPRLERRREKVSRAEGWRRDRQPGRLGVARKRGALEPNRFSTCSPRRSSRDRSHLAVEGALAAFRTGLTFEVAGLLEAGLAAAGAAEGVMPRIAVRLAAAVEAEVVRFMAHAGFD